MKLFRIILIFLLCPVALWAQNNTLSGVLLDKADNEPVIAGSVELLRARDSVYTAGTISDANGRFSLQKLNAGSYILKITYLGYHPVLKNIRLTADQPDLNLGKLYMETNDILLKETVVEGKKPEVIVKNDTIEYDASSYKVPENAAVEDLLKKLPGVEVDKDGNITANGKQIKRIMVDGKEFFSDDPQVASKNLPADMVEKLQVVDRKSDMARMTGFDDGEEETIINLMVRPGMKKGTMGNALIGAGADVEHDNDLRYQGAAFINNMKDNDRYTFILGRNNNNNMGAADLGANRFGGMRMRRGGGGSGITESTNFMMSLNKTLSKTATLNGDVRYNSSDRDAQSKVVRMTTLSDNEARLDSTFTKTHYVSDNISANFTLEWKPDTSNTFIFRPNVRYNQSHSDETETASRYNFNTMNRQYSSVSPSHTQGKGFETGGSLDFSHKFNKPGRVFSINARGSFNKSFSWENSQTTYEGTTLLPNLNQRAENDDRTSNYRFSVSYVEPLGKNNFLQAFYRISHYDTRSINSTYDVDFPETDFATLNDSLSRSTLRNSTEQRFGLNFKSVRAKYNYTVGINYDPVNSRNETYQPDFSTTFPYNPDKRLENRQGDVLISSIPLNTPNFSPVVNFNYLFSQRNNLRIDYEGETNQPTANQLKDFIDKSRPTEWTQGNPNLKTGYNNNLRIRYSRYVPETQLMYNLNLEGNLPVNDITAITVRMDSIINKTTYENINGNWNVLLRGMFNLPLRNKRFSVANFTNVSYRNQNSFIARQVDENRIEKSKNTMRNFVIMDNANLNYRSDLFDIGMNVSVNYSDIRYSLQSRNNQQPLAWGVGGSTTWYLPHNFTLESNINYTHRSGYNSGFNLSEVIWNASATKQLFNKKFGTGSLKLQIYDILQDRNSITSSTTTNGWQTSEVTVIPSYFMCSFIYKFTVFPKSSSAKEDDFRPQWGGPGTPPPGGGRPDGPPPGGMRMF